MNKFVKKILVGESIRTVVSEAVATMAETTKISKSLSDLQKRVMTLRDEVIAGKDISDKRLAKIRDTLRSSWNNIGDEIYKYNYDGKFDVNLTTTGQPDDIAEDIVKSVDSMKVLIMRAVRDSEDEKFVDNIEKFVDRVDSIK